MDNLHRLACKFLEIKQVHSEFKYILKMFILPPGLWFTITHGIVFLLISEQTQTL